MCCNLENLILPLKLFKNGENLSIMFYNENAMLFFVQSSNLSHVSTNISFEYLVALPIISLRWIANMDFSNLISFVSINEFV